MSVPATGSKHGETPTKQAGKIKIFSWPSPAASPTWPHRVNSRHEARRKPGWSQPGARHGRSTPPPTSVARSKRSVAPAALTIAQGKRKEPGKASLKMRFGILCVARAENLTIRTRCHAVPIDSAAAPTSLRARPNTCRRGQTWFLAGQRCLRRHNCWAWSHAREC